MTEVEVKVADWAIEKACQLMGIDARTLGERERLSRGSGYVLAFAEYIAEHEAAPVDPLEAAFAAAFSDTDIGAIGGWSGPFARFKAELQRRGLELGKAHP